MATTFYFRSTNIAAGGTRDTLLRVSGSTVVSNTITTNPPNDVLINTWVSRPLVGFTLSGNVALNLWGNETGASVNSAIKCIVKKLSTGYVLSSNIAVLTTTELDTKSIRTAHTATNTAPISTAISNGEFLVVELYATPSGGNPNPGSATISYDGPTAGADGDSYVTFFETVNIRNRAINTT